MKKFGHSLILVIVILLILGGSVKQTEAQNPVPILDLAQTTQSANRISPIGTPVLTDTPILTTTAELAPSLQPSTASPTDNLTTLLAIYAAGLSTILGIRELQKGSRRVGVIIEHVRWESRCQITITNIGYRPITIAEINMEINLKQDGQDAWDNVPRSALFASQTTEQPLLPVMLEDGEHITLPLSDVVYSFIFQSKGYVTKPKVYVYDVEGHVFTKFKMLDYDTKWGYYRSIKP